MSHSVIKIPGGHRMCSSTYNTYDFLQTHTHRLLWLVMYVAYMLVKRFEHLRWPCGISAALSNWSEKPLSGFDLQGQ